jgi:glutaconate CoA-transferase subunit A
MTYHPGISLAHIQRKTGFELSLAPDAHETPAPTAQEITLLREQIDPLGVRKLETLGGQARKDLIRDILQREGAL